MHLAPKNSHHPLALWLLAVVGLCGLGPRAWALEISYGGRLAEASGEPVEGPVNLILRFYDVASGGSVLLTRDFTNVTLVDGIFQIALDLDGAALATLLGDGSKPLFVEAVALGKVYPRQRYSYVPLALRVPVDGTTISYNSDGELSVIAAGGSGAVSSVSGRTGSVTLTTNDVPPGADTSRQYFSPSLARGVLSATSPVVYSSSTGQLSLSYTPVNKAGDTMSGALAMGGSKITGLGAPSLATDAATKGYVDGSLGGTPLDLSSAANGQVLKWSTDRFVFAEFPLRAPLQFPDPAPPKLPLSATFGGGADA